MSTIIESLLTPRSLLSSDLRGYAIAVLPVFLYFVAKSFASGKNGKKNLPMPPGPKPKPLIGNMLDIPQVKPWAVYKQWCDTYGMS